MVIHYLNNVPNILLWSIEEIQEQLKHIIGYNTFIVGDNIWKNFKVINLVSKNGLDIGVLFKNKFSYSDKTCGIKELSKLFLREDLSIVDYECDKYERESLSVLAPE